MNIKRAGISNPHPGWSAAEIAQHAAEWRAKPPASSRWPHAVLRPVGHQDSLEDLAQELTRKGIPISGRDLAEYNFGTRKPPEINWYLKHYCGCEETTWDRYNFVFSNASPDNEVIWLPTEKKQPPVEAPVALEGKNTTGPAVCPARSGTQCTFAGIDAPFPPCRERPGFEADPATVQRGGARSKRVVRTTQDVSIIALTWTTARISQHTEARPYGLGDENANPYQWFVHNLNFQWEAEQTLDDSEARQQEERLPPKWREQKARLAAAAQQHLIDPSSLSRVARAANALLAEGRVRRFFVRGYAGRAETRGWPPVDVRDLSMRRAEFVIEQLEDRFRVDFGSVKIIPVACAAYYAPKGSHTPSHAAEVEPDLIEPVTRAGHSFINAMWNFHHYEGPKATASPNDAIHYLDFKEYDTQMNTDATGEARSEADMTTQRNLALAYVDAFEELIRQADVDRGRSHREERAATIESIRNMVRGWTWTGGQLPPLYAYWIKVTGDKRVVQGTPSPGEAASYVDTSDPNAPSVAEVQRILETPNHLREDVLQTTISAQIDNSVVQRLAANEDHPKSIPVSGLIIRFKPEQPLG